MYIIIKVLLNEINKCRFLISSMFAMTYITSDFFRVKLPKMEAYMLEQLRFLTQVPFMIPHMAVRDTEVAGYKVSQLICQLLK